MPKKRIPPYGVRRGAKKGLEKPKTGKVYLTLKRESACRIASSRRPKGRKANKAGQHY